MQALICYSFLGIRQPTKFEFDQSCQLYSDFIDDIIAPYMRLNYTKPIKNIKDGDNIINYLSSHLNRFIDNIYNKAPILTYSYFDGIYFITVDNGYLKLHHADKISETSKSIITNYIYDYCASAKEKMDEEEYDTMLKHTDIFVINITVFERGTPLLILSPDNWNNDTYYIDSTAKQDAIDDVIDNFIDQNSDNLPDPDDPSIINNREITDDDETAKDNKPTTTHHNDSKNKQNINISDSEELKKLTKRWVTKYKKKLEDPEDPSTRYPKDQNKE